MIWLGWARVPHGNAATLRTATAGTVGVARLDGGDFEGWVGGDQRPDRHGRFSQRPFLVGIDALQCPDYGDCHTVESSGKRCAIRAEFALPGGADAGYAHFYGGTLDGGGAGKDQIGHVRGVKIQFDRVLAGGRDFDDRAPRLFCLGVVWNSLARCR